jgi:hypothetical protein
LLSDVFIEHGLVDQLEKAKLMNDLAIETGKPLNARNLKSMGIIKEIRVKPTLDTSWESLKDQRKMPHGLARFFKNEPRDAVAIYLQRLLDDGVDISDFSLDDCLDSEEDLVRYKRGVSERQIAAEARKAKKARLGESSGTKSSAPLQTSSSGMSIPLATSVPMMASSHPLTTPPLYTTSEIPPSITRTSQPTPVLNIARTFIPPSIPAQTHQSTSSSSSSSIPESPPYVTVSSDPEPSDPDSPTIATLYAHRLASQQQTLTQSEVTSPLQTSLPPQQTTTLPSETQPSDPFTSNITPPIIPAVPEPDSDPLDLNPLYASSPSLQPEADSELQPEAESEPQTLNLSPPNSPPHSPEPEPELTIPTLEEAIRQVAEASIQKVKSLANNSEVSDDPKSVRTNWNRVISWMTSESYRLKSVSEQVRNGYIRDAEARLQERLAREAEARRLEEERLAKEAEEEAKRLEEERLAKEAEILRQQEAEAMALADAEAQAAAEAEAQQALTQGESSTAVPMILQTLKDLKEDQNILRDRMDKQDTVNENIQKMLAMILQKLPQNP